MKKHIVLPSILRRVNTAGTRTGRGGARAAAISVSVALVALYSISLAAAGAGRLLRHTPLERAFAAAASPLRPVLAAVALAAPQTQSNALNVERRGHTATRLPDGRVLVGGGESVSGPLSSSEIFDPVTRTFTLGASAGAARTEHAALRLNDGRILITGGRNQGGVLASTELYDPSSATFTDGPSMGHARAGHTATLLADGRILVTGGDEEGTAEIFDAQAESVTALEEPLYTARMHHSALLLNDGKVFIVGGVGPFGNSVQSGEMFNPADASFSAIPGAMRAPRTRPTLRELTNGFVQVIGGDDEGTMEIYVPATDDFQAYAHLPGTTPMADALSARTRSALFRTGQTDALLNRASHTITEIPQSNLALVAGGANSGGQILNTVAVVNSSTAALTTDRIDYAPGQLVTISGTGFQPNEVVTLVLHEEQAAHADRTFTAAADAQGNFTSADFTPEAHHFGVHFVLTAKGQSSAFVAQTAFTDAGSIDVRVTIGNTFRFYGQTAPPLRVKLCQPVTDGSGDCLPINGKTIEFAVNGEVVGSDVTSTKDIAGVMTDGMAVLPYDVLKTAGAYTVVASFAGDEEYQADQGTSTLTIGKALTTITWPTPAAITYGTALGSTQLNATIKDTTSNSQFTGQPVAGTFNYTLTTGAIPASGYVPNAGSNALRADFVPADAVNYGNSSRNNSVSVSKVLLTVTPNNFIRLYGQPNPELTGTVVGLVNNDPITPVFSTAATQASAAGSYPITFTLSDPANKLKNYTQPSPLKSGTLSINKAPLDVTAHAKSRPYGQDNPPLTFSYSGFVLGENEGTPGVLSGAPTLTTTATAASAGGAYPITVSPGSLAANNYAFNFVGATLTVTKAQSVLNLSGLAQSFDGTPKSITVTTDPAGLTGVSVTYNSSAQAPTNTGSYNVVATLNNPNYQSEIATGVLVINKAEQAINFAPIPDKKFGGVRANVASSQNGGVATASSTTGPDEYPGQGLVFPPSGVNNGDRKGLNWEQGGGWRDGTTGFPDWIQVEFDGSKAVDEIDVFTIQDNYSNPAEPTQSMTFSSWGITSFDVQYWDGSQWVTVPGGSVTGNNNVWRRFTFTPVTTTKVRVSINNALAGRSRVAEVEAWGTPGSPFALAATSSANLPVAFEVVSGNATLSGNTLTLTGAGSVTVRATQAGDANRNPAAPVTRTFNVAKADATINILPASLSQTYNGTPRTATVTTTPAGLSGLVVSYSEQDGTPISAPTNAGTYKVTASLDNPNYTAAPVSATLVIAQATVQVDLESATYVFDGQPHAVNATLTGAEGQNIGTLTYSYTPQGNVGPDTIEPAIPNPPPGPPSPVPPAPAYTTLNDPPPAPRLITVFPERDFVTGENYSAADGQVTINVLRRDATGALITVGSATATPQDDPATPEVEGFFEVNHPGGACWVGTTPDIRAGDIVRVTNASGVADQTTVAHVSAGRPVKINATTVVISGRAMDAAGNPLPLTQIEQRLISSSADPFVLSQRRDLRAPGNGTLVYDDEEDPTHWTATYTGLSAADVERALRVESRILWLGRNPAAENELTIFEVGDEVFGGPQAPCSAPLEGTSPVKPSPVPPAPAYTTLNDPPPAPHLITVFPERDFVTIENYAASDGPVTINVLRRVTLPDATTTWRTVGSSTVELQDDPTTPQFDGFAEVNHPGGGCWVGSTPDIQPGDIVRVTNASGVADQTTVANVKAEHAIQTSTNTVVVHGTAQDAAGQPLPIDQLEQRMISGSADRFNVNGRRDIRAVAGGGEVGTLAYDAPGSIHWTATYTNLGSQDVARALRSETRILWLGRNQADENELTIFEIGDDVFQGPQAPCSAPREGSDLPIWVGVYDVSVALSGNPNFRVTADTAQITITKATPIVNVTGGPFESDGQPHPATVTVTGVGGNPFVPPSVNTTVTYSRDGSTPTSNPPVTGGTYDATAAFAGSKNYGAENGAGRIVVNNAKPVAQGKTVSTDEDKLLTITFKATDADGDKLTYSVVNAPAHGQLGAFTPLMCVQVVGATCDDVSATYTPHANYNGPDSLTFMAYDGKEYSLAATVTINVNPVNDGPQANPGGPYSGTVGTAVQFNGNGSSDSDGTITSYAWDFGDGSTGSGAMPSHTYATASTYDVTLTVTDNGGVPDSDSTAITINAAYSGADIVWVEDAVPAGAATSGLNEGWNWVGSSPAPVSGSRSHQSELVNDLHQHFFYNATSTLTVNIEDKLFAYVYLDPANPPSEVMLQWNDGTWEHRAYWGANNIGWGTDGTDSRRYMGALPGAGRWVRLEVPASAVGLEGHTLNGMAFSLWKGRATWDQAGKTAISGSGYPTAGLVGYWKFDENSGTRAIDSSPSGIDGTLQNGPAWATGQSRAALNFDGVNDMVSSNGLANVTNNFTLSFWALPSATHEIDGESNGGGGGVSGQRYAFWPEWYCAGVSVGTNGVSVYEHAANYMPATLVHSATLSDWTHITIVYENRQPRLYLNGLLVKTGVTSAMSSVQMNPTYIGGQVYGYYAGKLDEVRVYNRALTAAEVASLPYGNQLPVVNAGGPYSGTAGKSIQFNGGPTFPGVGGSYDPDGTIISYAWKFGDGGTGSGATPLHTYTAVGTYTATLTVTDNSGAQSSANATVTVTVGNPPGSAEIVFASNRDGNSQIYFMNADGSGQVRLTNNFANDEFPRWSPNNAQIVFQSDRANPFWGVADIYVMNADGSGQTRLTSDTADDSAPVWSPDGSKIAFQSARNGVNYQVYVMNADGSGQVNISNSAANDGQPSWSPDGTKIAFTSDRDHPGKASVYVMNADGSNQTRLTFSGSGLMDEQPAWSPNGTRIAFVSTRDSVVETWQETDDDVGTVTKTRVNTNKEVYLMNADGTNQLRLTNMLGNDDSPRWSRDGAKLLFRSDRERECCNPLAQVWVMYADGSNQLNLSNNGFGDYGASW